MRNLLTFARKRQTTRAMVDVNHVVRETLALRAYEQRVTNITVIDALAAGLPQVFADGHQVQQVLLNLVINAEQAMLSANGRGILVVRTWHDAEQESVILEINDDGPGIPDEVQPKIFDPFFTTKEVGKGTGLGLTVAYAIVQEHGGRIRLESRPNVGASFYVELPVTGAKLAQTPASRSRLQEPVEALAGSTILVVEDEAALAGAVIDALRDVGYLVEHASDGEEALVKVRQQAFDLVICDLKMPRMDGMAFYRTLSAVVPGLARRVIFVTGDVAGTDAERFLEESGCRWLAKPFRLGDLLRAVREGLTLKATTCGLLLSPWSYLAAATACRGRVALSVARAGAGRLFDGLYCSTTECGVAICSALGCGSSAFSIFGFFAANAMKALRISATCCGPMSPSWSRRRRIARAWSCETRDSFTPISAPISFIVTSP